MDPSIFFFFTPRSRLICLVLSMHNGWASRAALRAQQIAAKGSGRRCPGNCRRSHGMGVGACTRGRASAHAHAFCLHMGTEMSTLARFKEPLSRHRTVKSNQGGSSDRQHIDQVKGKHAKSTSFTHKQLYSLLHRNYDRTATFVIKCLCSKGQNASRKCTLQLFIMRCRTMYLF